MTRTIQTRRASNGVAGIIGLTAVLLVAHYLGFDLEGEETRLPDTPASEAAEAAEDDAA